MAYSTIPRKKCKCGCKKYPKPGYAGYAYSCAPEKVKDKVKKKTRKQQREARQRLQNKVKNLRPVDTEETEQELWFKSAHYELAKDPHCMECSEFIPERFYRAATAHILPKKKEYGFPSVATHPVNRLFLGGGCGCHNKTHRWDHFSKMKVWPLAVAAFIEMYPYIAEEERKNIPDVLRQFIPL